jgi:hypothetical protein
LLTAALRSVWIAIMRATETICASWFIRTCRRVTMTERPANSDCFSSTDS